MKGRTNVWIVGGIIGLLILLVIAAVVVVLAFVVPHKDSDQQEIVSQPSDTVDAYFKALQENRQLDALNLYDTSDLETVAQKYGMNLDEFKAQMASSDTGEGSIVFEGLAYEITIDGDKATATITGGTVIMTDETGKTDRRTWRARA